MARQVLEGIKVVDLGQGAAVPELGRILGEFGADVIEVESRHYPDFMRRYFPLGKGLDDLDYNPGFNEANRNKRSLAVNLNDPRGRDMLLEIIKQCDIVCENNQREVVFKWGLDYESVRKVKPDIIYLSSTGFGGGGPYENFRSYTGAVGFSGFMFLASYPDAEAPAGVAVNHPDHIAGKFFVVPIIAALDYRRRTGKGQYIEASQLETAAALLGEVYLDLLINGRMAVPVGNRHPYAAPHGAYKCQGTVKLGDNEEPIEDRWVAISVFTEAEWKGLCAAMGNPAWTKDPKFITLAARKQNEDELDELINQWTRQHDAFEAQDTLQAHGVPAGVVEHAEDHIVHDPQMKHRGSIVHQEHPAAGWGYYPAQPIRLAATPAMPSIPAGILGQHTDEICRDYLGLSDAQIESLRADGVIGY